MKKSCLLPPKALESAKTSDVGGLGEQETDCIREVSHVACLAAIVSVMEVTPKPPSLTGRNT